MIQFWIAPLIRPFTTTETNQNPRSGCWDRGVARRQRGVYRRDRSRIQRLAGEADDLPGGERGHDADGPDLARQAILVSREDVAGSMRTPTAGFSTLGMRSRSSFADRSTAMFM
jgi:hypothetical protein